MIQRPTLIAVGVILLATSSASSAQSTTTIHKCQLEGGSYVYSDQSCGDGETFEITSKEPEPANQPNFDTSGIALPPGTVPRGAYFGMTAGSYENFEVQVEKISRGWYRVRAEDVIIQAPRCLELSLGDQAILSMRGSAGRLFFLDSGDACDVEGLFLPASETSGKYRLIVDREDQDLYVTDDGTILVETKNCYEYTFSEEALLVLDGRYSSVLHFADDQCDVEGVYERGAM